MGWVQVPDGRKRDHHCLAFLFAIIPRQVTRNETCIPAKGAMSNRQWALVFEAFLL